MLSAPECTSSSVRRASADLAGVAQQSAVLCFAVTRLCVVVANPRMVFVSSAKFRFIFSFSEMWFCQSGGAQF